MTKKLTMLAGSFVLLASSALTTLAADQEISWIYCGDKIDPIHEKYIKEWEGKNEGWKVKPEVVGWEQCQDKATTLAVAGTRLPWPMSARAR